MESEASVPECESSDVYRPPGGDRNPPSISDASSLTLLQRQPRVISDRLSLFLHKEMGTEFFCFSLSVQKNRITNVSGGWFDLGLHGTLLGN